MRKKLFLMVFLIFLTSAVMAQSASISSINPASKSVTVGQSFSVDVSYSTNSVNSCQLEVVGSSLPASWSSSGQISIDTTSGSTSTVRSPKITASGSEAEADINLRLSCSSNTVSPSDSSSFHATANNPPFLEAERQTESSIDVEEGGKYTVSFSVSNTGSSDTESAKAVVETPKGYTHPSTIELKEAGQDSGVIRAGKSAGTTSFQLTAEENPERGDMVVELTSSEIGTTDSFKVDLLAPEQEPTDSGSESSGGGAGGAAGAPGSGENTTSEAENTSDSIRKRGDEVGFEFDEAISSVNLEMSSSPEQYGLEIYSQESKPSDVDDLDRKVYRYVELTSDVSSENLETADIKFSVPREWMRSNNHSISDISLMRYNGDWSELPTSSTGANSTHVNYTAGTSGFSYFAIAAEDSSTQEKDVQEGTSGQSRNLVVLGGIAALVVIAALAAVYYFSKGRSDADLESRSRRRLTELSEDVKEKVERGEERNGEELYHELEKAEQLHEQSNYREALLEMDKIERKI